MSVDNTMAISHPHRYEVTHVHDPKMGQVRVGDVLRETDYLGAVYTYQVEREGRVTAWCSVRYLGVAAT